MLDRITVVGLSIAWLESSKKEDCHLNARFKPHPGCYARCRFRKQAKLHVKNERWKAGGWDKKVAIPPMASKRWVKKSFPQKVCPEGPRSGYT